MYMSSSQHTNLVHLSPAGNQLLGRIAAVQGCQTTKFAGENPAVREVVTQSPVSNPNPSTLLCHSTELQITPTANYGNETQWYQNMVVSESSAAADASQVFLQPNLWPDCSLKNGDSIVEMLKIIF
jgi:hypothetical protein